MALTRDEIIALIDEEIGYLKEGVLLTIVNDYNSANSYPIIYENTISNIAEIVNDSLTEYFEYLANSKETYNKSDNYFYINGNGWFTSFDDIYDETDSGALADFIYDHFDEYDSYFDVVVDAIEEAEEDEEEE